MMGNKERCDAHNLTEIKIIADYLSDFIRDNRMLLIALMAVPIGGASPLFGVSPHPLLNAEGLVICLIVGVVAGLASALLTGLVYGFEDLFYKLPIHWAWWPTVGGLETELDLNKTRERSFREKESIFRRWYFQRVKSDDCAKGPSGYRSDFSRI